MDFDGSLCDVNVQRLLEDLGPLTNKLLILDEKDVQWFPRHISELDLIAHRTLDAGVDLECDHPGFNDPEYRKRRELLADSAMKHKWYEPIPKINYTQDEILVWTSVYDKMQDLWSSYACKEYLVSILGAAVIDVSFSTSLLKSSQLFLFSLLLSLSLSLSLARSAFNEFINSKLWL